MADTVPNGGVLPGPRSFQWQPIAPATVSWAEALDNGDPKNKVPHRDKVMTLAAPFTGAPRRDRARPSIASAALSWTDEGAALLTENDRARRWTRTWIIDKPRRRAAQAVGPQPGGLLRQSGHAAAARARVGHVDHPAERRQHLPRRPGRGAGRRAPVPRSPRSHDAQERAPVPDRRADRTRRWSACCHDDGSRILTRYETRNDPPNVLRARSEDRRPPCADQLSGSGAAAAGHAEAARHLQAQRRRRAVGDDHHAAGLDAGAGPAADAALGLPARVHRSRTRPAR